MQGEAERSNERHLKDVTSRTCTEAKRIHQRQFIDRSRSRIPTVETDHVASQSLLVAGNVSVWSILAQADAKVTSKVSQTRCLEGLQLQVKNGIVFSRATFWLFAPIRGGDNLENET